MSEPRRHVLHVFATFDPGGPQVRAVQCIARAGAGWRHTIVAMDGRTGAAGRLPAGSEVEIVPPPTGGGARVVRAMRGLLRDKRPDLLCTYNWGAIETIAAAWLTPTIPVVHHEDGFGPEETERPLPRRALARRALLRRAAGVVVPSARLARICREHFGVSEGRLHHLPNGVDLARFRVGPDGAARPRPVDAAVTIGCVGHLRPEKNQTLLVEAFAAMQRREEARLLLVGDGPLREPCAALVVEHDLGERVEMRGAVADTVPCYAEMDVFAVPSRTEQMPLVVLEAMAAGLPVAGTDVGDLRLMLDLPGPDSADAAGTGLVAVGDAAALAGRLDRLVGDAALRRTLGAANRRRCERHYALDTCLDRYLEVYRAAMMRRPARYPPV